MKYTIRKCVDEQDFGTKARTVFLNAVYSSRYYPGAPDTPCRVILPTGNTPLPFYAALRDMASDVPPFEYCQLDEYIGLSQGDARLFSEQLAKLVLNPLKISSRMIFNSCADPLEEVSRIRDWHLKNGPADVAVLGIGENGHVGFNEPGAKFHDRANIVTLEKSTLEANNAYGNGPVPERAITLGLGDLLLARETILLVRGAKKADILAHALFGAVTESVPASYLQNYTGKLTIVADEAALAKLPSRILVPS